MLGRDVRLATPLLDPDSMDFISDIERRQALVELLAKSDPIDAHRRHRRVFEGREDRYRLLPYLAGAYVQTRLVEWRERAMLRENRP